MDFVDGRLPIEQSFRSYRSQRIRAKQQAKLRAVFEGKVFRVVAKVDLTGTGERFFTPLGSPGIRGYLLVEDGNPDNQVYLGERTLGYVRNDYIIVD